MTWRSYRLKRGAKPGKGIVGLDDPWAANARLKVKKSTQNRPWPADVIRKVFGAATPEFRALMVCLLLSAQRLGDVVRWGPDAYDPEAGKLAFQRVDLGDDDDEGGGRKNAEPPAAASFGRVAFGQRKTDASLRLAVPAHMAEAFAAMRGRVPDCLLCTTRGRPWTEVNAQEALLVLRRFTGVRRYVLHGLRSTGPTALIELGFSTREVMAITGHTDERQFQRYIEGADKSKLSERALAALADHFDGVLSPPPGVEVNTRRFSGLTGRAAARARRETAAGTDGPTGNSLATGNSGRKGTEKT